MTRFKLTRDERINWTVRVTKEFADEYGGGAQTFYSSAPHIHGALDVARGMVTVSAGQGQLLSNPMAIFICK